MLFNHKLKIIWFFPCSHVAWINPNGQGFNIPYRAITVHAISRDLSSFPHECLYLMIDSDVMGELRDVPGHGGDGPQDNNSDDGFEEEEGNEVREIRLVPQDKTMCKWRLGMGYHNDHINVPLILAELVIPELHAFKLTPKGLICCIFSCSVLYCQSGQPHQSDSSTWVLEPLAFFWGGGDFWEFGCLGLDFVCPGHLFSIFW